ncbi:hypothetical protein SDC9_181574 [bioreactor metagenome]|uniref:Uncharacterized protein n=1 Tax=bioreactor metagenome TaxID=1076179 RepID=A0A645H4X1_9ZZZZ
MLHARNLAARNRVCGHEGADLIAQRGAGSLHHVGLGGAHVHDQHLRRDQVLDGLERGLGGRHGHGDQHDVGTGHGQQRRGGFHVDHAQRARALGGGGRLAVAHHAFDQPGALERPRERASHETAADET